MTDNPMATVLPSTPADRAALRDRIAALFRHPLGAERLGDATPGEIADAVLAVVLGPDDDEMAASLRRDGFGDDEIADILSRPIEQLPVSRQWCKCPSCWGWFVEDHPGEDLDELGKDLGWWSGLPEHRDAPADVCQFHSPTGSPCECGHPGADDCHPNPNGATR